MGNRKVSVPDIWSFKTEVGYVNGNTENPTYEDACYKNTGHAETVKVLYYPEKISLKFLLDLFYDSINPTSINHQGGDWGSQYRTGIYYVDEKDREIIQKSIYELQKRYEVFQFYVNCYIITLMH